MIAIFENMQDYFHFRRNNPQAKALSIISTSNGLAQPPNGTIITSGTISKWELTRPKSECNILINDNECRLLNSRSPDFFSLIDIVHTYFIKNSCRSVFISTSTPGKGALAALRTLQLFSFPADTAIKFKSCRKKKLGGLIDIINEISPHLPYEYFTHRWKQTAATQLNFGLFNNEEMNILKCPILISLTGIICKYDHHNIAQTLGRFLYLNAALEDDMINGPYGSAFLRTTINYLHSINVIDMRSSNVTVSDRYSNLGLILQSHINYEKLCAPIYDNSKNWATEADSTQDKLLSNILKGAQSITERPALITESNS